jgi:hypothetical protein
MSLSSLAMKSMASARYVGDERFALIALPGTPYTVVSEGQQACM